MLVVDSTTVEPVDLLVFVRVMTALGVILYITDVKARENIGVERQDAFGLIELVDRVGRRPERHLRSGHRVVGIDRLVLYHLSSEARP